MSEVQREGYPEPNHPTDDDILLGKITFFGHTYYVFISPCEKTWAWKQSEGWPEANRRYIKDEAKYLNKDFWVRAKPLLDKAIDPSISPNAKKPKG